MSITQTMTTSFKVELLEGIHNFGPTSANTFKIALYTSAATLGATTTVYSTSNEVVATGYTAGGNTLTISTTPTSGGTTAYVSFSNTTWGNSTITANGALIYNSTQGNKAVAVLAFGGDKSSVSGDFTIQFPTADSTSAIIRVA
jgi:hypothetical protein